MKRVHKFSAAMTLGLAAAGSAAAATQYGTVLEVMPVIEPVPVVERVCIDEPVAAERRPSGGGGALLGAIIGGVVGHGIGSGSGRAAATGLGIVAGAAIGDHSEARAAAPVTSYGQRCGQATRYEDRVVGYDVEYEFEGQRRSARMAHDPGAVGTQIPVEVQVMPAGAERPRGEGRRVPRAYAPRQEEGFGPPPWPYTPPQPVYIAPPHPGPYYYDYGYGYAVPQVWIGVRHHRHRRR